MSCEDEMEWSRRYNETTEEARSGGLPVLDKMLDSRFFPIRLVGVTALVAYANIASTVEKIKENTSEQR
jgi:hypothetical protein